MKWSLLRRVFGSHKKVGTSAKFSPRQQQVQNFPHTMVAGSNLSWQDIERKAVYTEAAGPVCKCMGKCTLEGSVQGEG